MTKVVGIFLMFAVLFGILLASDPAAGSVESQQTLGLRIGTLGILVLAVAPVIISGGIDLSIGSVLVLSGICFVLLMKYGLQLPPESPYIAMLHLACGVGFSQLLRDSLKTRFRLHPGLATVASLVLGAATGLFFPLLLTFREAFQTRIRLEPGPATVAGLVLTILVCIPLALLFFLGLRFPPLAPYPAAIIVILGAGCIGLLQGGLITKVRLQPFLVTLCGLFIARGMARWIPRLVTRSTGTVSISGSPGVAFDLSQIDFFVKGLFHGLPWFIIGSLLCLGLVLGIMSATLKRLSLDQKSLLAWIGSACLLVALLNGLVQWSEIGIPWPLVLMLILAVVLGVLLHATVYGRYLYAIGANEQAARYAGIASDRYKVMTYVWCSMLTAVGGILFILENGGANPANDGNFYELYAITGAVLGGCSLRGGEGSIVGIVLGAAIMPLLRNIILFADVPDDVEFAVVGMALLLGTIVDEALKRRAAARV